ncbi:hypothetical protein CBR_g49644 [Chara braunii]|uniref:Reverse transcriptase/retrotransposon-derived protein RNase H-like domain-containing protein n=1 Tax=Chara braunii TaxID=69332 RepID=A0A388M5P0_CHABU|nr:hypothetical protein CBR_g49644 [Chara braunii]|eukprot:GBG89793.1 hypothetical protein CBR_g49644 [Chara braunii]
MRSFLGMTGYYRNFVKNYSIVAAPLTNLTRLDTPWEWTDRCEAAFRHLKHALTHHEVLKLPDPNKPFIVTTDASQYGIGAVLVQQEGPKFRPAEYMSKKMSSQKLAKSTYEKELYAIYKAWAHWRHYLLGRFFIVRTDHQTLKWMRTQPVLSDALKRWIEVIEQYNFEPWYLKGEYNKVVDALSRRPDFSGALITEFELTDNVTRSLVEAYREDQFMSEIIHRLEAKDKVTSAKFELVNDLLLRRLGINGTQLQMTSENHTEANGQAEQLTALRERQDPARSSSREDRREDDARRGPQTCYGCRVVGHYRTECWRYWTDPVPRRRMEADGYVCPTEFNSRTGAPSPPRDRAQPPQVVEATAQNRLEELGRTVASVQEFVEMERARRAEREQLRRERDEGRLAEEAARAAEVERAVRKAEKLRKREEEQLAMAKAVEVQLSVRLGDIREEIKTEVRKALSSSLAKQQVTEAVIAKGKEKVVAIEDLPSTSGTSSEVEVITEGTGNLSLQEKGKRGEDVPVTTPAKRTSKRSGIRPVRLSERLQRTRTKISVRRPARCGATKALTAMKPPARDTMMERMLFLDSTRRELSKMDYDTLHAICREEGVNYATKVQAIFDVADRRVQVRFGEALPDFSSGENVEDDVGHSGNDETDCGGQP